MDINTIENSEILYRVVRRSYPSAYDNGPTAALFMDANGVSVERDGGREETDIIDSLKNRFYRNEDYRCAVKISAGECRNAETFPAPVGNTRNIYHAEIWDSENEKRITLVKALRLAQICRTVGQ